MVQVPIQMQDMLYSHSCLLDDQFRKEKGKNNLVAFPESILLLLSLLWVDYVFEKLLWQMSENSFPSLTAEREPSFKALGGALKREDFSRFKPLKSKEYRVSERPNLELFDFVEPNSNSNFYHRTRTELEPNSNRTFQ